MNDQIEALGAIIHTLRIIWVNGGIVRVRHAETGRVYDLEEIYLMFYGKHEGDYSAFEGRLQFVEES
jgi:hypothetical protein